MKNFIKTTKKYIIIFLIIILSSISLTGCRDNYEIEQLAIVLGLGFDLSKSGITITLQVLKNQDTNDNTRINIYTATASDADTAIYKIRSSVGRKFIYSHINCIIVSENVAVKSIAPLLDVTMRFNEIRPNVPLLVTKGKAADILTMKSKDNPISSFSVVNSLEVQKNLGFTAFSSNLDFAESVQNEPYITSISVIDIDRNYFRNSDAKSNNGSIYTFPGNAVFRKDKLVGYMSNNEVRGLSWTRGDVQWGNLQIKTADNKTLNFDIKRSSSKRTVSFENGKFKFKIFVKGDTTIRDMAGNTDPNKNPNSLKLLRERQNEAIKNEVELAITAAQKSLKADIFDFGALVYRTYPQQWKESKDNWNKIFPNVDIEVVVDSNIIQTGTISKSPF
jgi:spore germination protein KC